MFYNLMEEQSKTITGKISNMSDAISVMLNEVGKANEEQSIQYWKLVSPL